jgi:hypothetical protein
VIRRSRGTEFPRGTLAGGRRAPRRTTTGEAVPDSPIAELQRTVGNAAVCTMLSALRAADMPEIALAGGGPGALDLHAGIPAGQEPPEGMNTIQAQNTTTMSAAGYTGIKMAGAFVTPDFATTWIRPPPGSHDHYVTVDPPLASPDAVHESLYPEPGDHRWGVAKPAQLKEGTPSHRVSMAMSRVIQDGEQEHLNDAARAYELTYGLITDRIAALGGRRFGPAPTPAAAEQLAANALDATLPPALSVRLPAFRAAWVAVLEALLRQSSLRDLRGWHDIQHGKPVKRRDGYVYPLEHATTTRIGVVASDQVVNYPPSP